MRFKRQAKFLEGCRGCAVALAVVAAGGCAKEPAEIRSSESAAPKVDLEASVASARIRANPRFSEFIRIEVPGTGRGPTIDALAAAGFIARSAGEKSPYALTEAGKAAGFESFEFQSGIPVFQVPVGGRRIESVLSIEPVGSSRDALATFTYRQVASPVGEELLRRGARLDGFAAPEPRTGHAVLSSTDHGWRVISVNL